MNKSIEEKSWSIVLEGERYLYGEGVMVDDTKAFNLFYKAACMDSVSALSMIVCCTYFDCMNNEEANVLVACFIKHLLEGEEFDDDVIRSYIHVDQKLGKSDVFNQVVHLAANDHTGAILALGLYRPEAMESCAESIKVTTEKAFLQALYNVDDYYVYIYNLAKFVRYGIIVEQNTTVADIIRKNAKYADENNDEIPLSDCPSYCGTPYALFHGTEEENRIIFNWIKHEAARTIHKISFFKDAMSLCFEEGLGVPRK